MKVAAPGKLILSGEHAVVYGQPAIAVALQQSAEASIGTQNQSDIAFNLGNLRYHASLTYRALSHLRRRLRAKYQDFLQGQCSIYDVLKQPFELPQFALAHLLKRLNLNNTERGLRVNVESSIPIGCGMGSSAATIISIIKALEHHFGLKLPNEKILELATETEQLQHGHCSGLDLQIALHGGCIYFHQGKATPRPVPTLPMTLVHSGTPTSTTGECVTHAAKYFKETHIASDFAKATQALDIALQDNDLSAAQQAIQENHHLLVKLGVVPETAQFFINEVMQLGGAAKICGAGSMRGDGAGAILVMMTQAHQPALQTLTERFGFTASPLRASAHGAMLVDSE